MNLEQRLQKEAKSEKWNKETIERVSAMISYELDENRKNLPYKRLFNFIEDFQLYYEIHTDWQGKSTTEMSTDTESGAYAFYFAFLRWTKKQTDDENKRKRLRQTIFKPRRRDWLRYETLDDWVTEYEMHKEWQGKSTHEMSNDTESGAKAFYNAFLSWTSKQTDDENERKRLRQTIFKPKQRDWLRYKTLDDWVTEYEMHQDWQGKSTYEMIKDRTSGASAFYNAFLRWTNKKTDNKMKRKKLMQTIFKPKHKKN